MKTMTIRDVKQRWPETERALAVERLLPNGGGGTGEETLRPGEAGAMEGRNLWQRIVSG